MLVRNAASYYVCCTHCIFHKVSVKLYIAYIMIKDFQRYIHVKIVDLQQYKPTLSFKKEVSFGAHKNKSRSPEPQQPAYWDVSGNFLKTGYVNPSKQE